MSRLTISVSSLASESGKRVAQEPSHGHSPLAHGLPQTHGASLYRGRLAGRGGSQSLAGRGGPQAQRALSRRSGSAAAGPQLAGRRLVVSSRIHFGTKIKDCYAKKLIGPLSKMKPCTRRGPKIGKKHYSREL
jgi:hypothetical protein